jgi:hypothetical protein
MNSHIDFRTLPSNVPSLCIPRVFTNWTESRIRRIFDDLGMGEILRIDVISKTTEKGEKFNRVFVHFKRWFSNQNADMARERLLNGKEIKIVYDDPWFWKVSAYRETKKNDYPDREERPRASIKFDDDRDRPSDRDRPIAPTLRDRDNRPRDKRRDDDRRPSERDRPRERDNRRRDDDRDRRRDRPRKENSKEYLDKELEKINPTIPESMRAHTPDPFVHTPDPISVKPLVKASLPLVKEEVDSGGIVYDMDMISQLPKRKILIKTVSTVKKAPLKVELEEGEITDEAK